MDEDKTVAKGKFKLQFPSTIVMLFFIIVAITVITYIVPAGEYDYIEQNGITMVDAESFHYVEQTPVNFFRMFIAIQEGFTEGAPIIFLIVFGYFWIYSVMQTGLFNALINYLVNSKIRNSKLLIPIIMLVFALAGSTYGEEEAVFGMIPVFVTLAMALGYDAIVGICISGMVTAVGFSAATTNPFTVGVAQSIAGLPLFSGIVLRWAAFIAFYLAAVFYTISYANKIKKNPEKSLLYGQDYSSFKAKKEDAVTFSLRHRILLLGMLVTVAVIVYGSLKLEWEINEMSAVFMISGIASSLIGQKKPNEIGNNLLSAFSEMTIAIIVIGLSRTVVVLMKEGQIIDTTIHAVSQTMVGLPAWATGIGMLVVQNIINFFIPSGSGQAAAIMPIMTPIADLQGLNRQIAVLAYQFGDGFSNLLWPNGVCAILCGIAKVPLGKWYRFFIPLFAIFFVLECAFIILAVLINYS